MLKFLFGRPGSGKTSKIIEMIKASVAMKKKTYFLVPEQQAFISESMLADLDPSSMLYFEVISFSRLCEIVFGICGGLTDNHIGSDIRNLIIWQSLREMLPMMQQYRNVKADSAFGSMMLSTIDELNANSVTPQMLEELSEKCSDTVTAKKISDISAIYTAFRENIAKRLGEDAIDSEDKLSILSNILSKNDVFKDCDIYVDSFVSFSGSELKILEELIKQADLFCISFCTDGYGTEDPHMMSIADTVKHFRLFAKYAGIEICSEHLKNNSRAKSQELRMLEKHLWDFSVTEATVPTIQESQRGNIEMAICKNEYEEACFAALKILEAHRAGINYSEMAVITRHCDNRKGIISAVFDSFGIPYFYSERTDLSSTPAARLLLSALKCITYNFQSSDVLQLLKTGLCNIDPIDADLFEDYCYTWDINGSKFTEELWSMNPDGYTKEKSERGNSILLKANKVRKALIPPLVILKQDMANAEGNTLESCRALYRYIEKIELSNNLASLAEYEIESGNIREAGEILRVYDYIISTLTKISRILGDDAISVEELTCALEIMLKHTDIGSVPTVNDYVTVGSADTLRVENIKISILLGLCEGEFPAAYSDSGILNENDKNVLEELGVSLSSRENRVISDELFHVYRAMTKCSEKLILCTTSSHIGGGALTPSSAWNRVSFLFNYINKFEFDLERVKLRASYTADKNNCSQDSCPEITLDRPLVNVGQIMDIDPLYVRMLFGDRLALTKSRISAFAECPYKYWCEYVLKLRETKPAAVSYADSGTIIHYILEHFLSRVRTEDGSVKSMDDKSTVALVNELMNDYISEINCPLPPSMMYTFSRLRDLTLVMVKDVMDEFANSQFKIVAMEKSISDKRAEDLAPMEIKVYDRNDSPIVLLGGVIDRLDCYDDGEQKYLRVVDYKTGTHKYSVDKIASGKDLQLPAYLFTAALEENRNFFGNDAVTFPASAMFLSAEEANGKITPVRSGFLLGEKPILLAASSVMDKSKLAGISITKENKVSGKAAVSKDDLNNINSTLRTTIATTAQNMYSGKAPRTPSKDACAFCSMKSSCPVACKDKNGK